MVVAIYRNKGVIELETVIIFGEKKNKDKNKNNDERKPNTK